MKRTLVLGASTNPSRYSHMAILRLLQHGHEVVAIGKGGGMVEGVTIEREAVPVKDIHTVTLYLNPTHQQPYYDYILSLRPQRIIFNPGTENDVLWDLAEAHGIACLEACTLVMLGTGQY